MSCNCNKKVEALKRVENLVNLATKMVKEHEEKTCEHIIIDARNEIISEGYFCTKCKKIFKAGDHFIKDYHEISN